MAFSPRGSPRARRSCADLLDRIGLAVVDWDGAELAGLVQPFGDPIDHVNLGGARSAA
jgi:hypothetical protein